MIISVLFVKSIKELIYNVYRGYLTNLLKRKIDPNKIFDFNSKKDVVVKHSLKDIICSNPHSLTTNSNKFLSNLYHEIYFISLDNYKKKPIVILKLLLKLILSVGNSCSHILEYYKYFKDQIDKNFSYLSKINKKVEKSFLILLNAAKDNFLKSWGQYEKMGLFLGHIFSIFRIYKPKNKVKTRLTQISRLLKALNDKKTRSKMYKLLEKKYKKLMGEEE